MLARNLDKFPQIPQLVATVFCSGKEGTTNFSIMKKWDEFYVADEDEWGRFSENFSSQELAFEALTKITKLSYGEKYTVCQWK